jgi:hypothetical protein
MPSAVMSNVIWSTPLSPGSWVLFSVICAQDSTEDRAELVFPVMLMSTDMASMPHDPGSGGVGAGVTHRWLAKLGSDQLVAKIPPIAMVKATTTVTASICRIVPIPLVCPPGLSD